MIAALILVAGFFLALAALAGIGDYMSDRSIEQPDRSGKHIPVRELALLGTNWLDKVPGYIGEDIHHHTRTRMALASSLTEREQA